MKTKKFFDALGTAFMIGLAALVVVALVAIPVYGWQTGDWELVAVTRTVAQFEASLLPASQEAASATTPFEWSCVEWSWLAGEQIYTMREKILSVDGVADYEILVTVEACGRTGPGRLYFRTQDSLDITLPFIQKGGEFEITRYGRNDMVLSVVTAR